MKFLVLIVLLGLAVGINAGVGNGHGNGGGGDDSGDGDGGAVSYPEVTETTVPSTKKFVLSWKEIFGALTGQGGGNGLSKFGPIEGTLNLALSGVVNNVRGLAKGLEPSVQAVYATPIPTLRIILAGANIKVCGPQTHLEYLLNHVVCFVNGPLYKGLAVSPLPICVPSREVQCHGPFLRLPSTLTPEMIGSGDYGFDQGQWDAVQGINLKEVDAEGNVISERPVGEAGDQSGGVKSELEGAK